jgi:hypothetical protein
MIIIKEHQRTAYDNSNANCQTVFSKKHIIQIVLKMNQRF